MEVARGASIPMEDEYPVLVNVTTARRLNQLWGVPLIGVMVRAILAIPHMLILVVMSIGLGFWALLGWIPILLLGRQPSLVVRFLTEFIHRYIRVLGYVTFLLPGGYPPLGPGDPSPVDTEIDVTDRRLSRFWGIPLVGIYAREIVAIPHLVVLAILGLLMFLSELVLWIPILFTGRYPTAFANLYARYLGYLARVQAYLLLLPVPYPPFSFRLDSPGWVDATRPDSRPAVERFHVDLPPAEAAPRPDTRPAETAPRPDNPPTDEAPGAVGAPADEAPSVPSWRSAEESGTDPSSSDETTKPE